MTKALLITAFVTMVTLTASGQDHVFPQPEGWGSETISFPITFAPGIPLSGQEELRFTPGWGDTTSVELWSYCFLWWIDQNSNLDAISLKNYLEEYYTGLVKVNIPTSSSTVNTTATVTETAIAGKPFTATVDLYDFIRHQPLTLNIDVHRAECPSNGKIAYFFAISPQPKTHDIWSQFARLWHGFACGN